MSGDIQYCEFYDNVLSISRTWSIESREFRSTPGCGLRGISLGKLSVRVSMTLSR